MDAARAVVRGDLLVREGIIAAVGDTTAAESGLPGGRAETRVDASGCFVLPGLVHGHLHLNQTLFRGLAEQADLLAWLRERIWPLEAAHTDASLTAAVNLGLLELVAGGVTCVNDMGTVGHGDALGAALEASGIRALFGKAMMDQGEGVPAGLRERTRDALEDSLALARRWNGAGAGRLHVTLAPRFILSCSEPLWRAVGEASHAHDLRVHTHIAESPREGAEVEATIGMSATRFFTHVGVLGRQFIGAHGVWLDDDDLSGIAGAGAALVHCPGSNLKLGSGVAGLATWRDLGIRRGIGSDGAACDNRLDTFHELSLAAGLSRARDRERALPAADVVALATCDGAEALGLGAVIGSLEPGKVADLILVDHTAPHMEPHATRDPYVTLVHAARASDVRLTMVGGRVLYRDAQWSTLDPGRVAADARMEARGVLARAGLA